MLDQGLRLPHTPSGVERRAAAVPAWDIGPPLPVHPPWKRSLARVAPQSWPRGSDAPRKDFREPRVEADHPGGVIDLLAGSPLLLLFGVAGIGYLVGKLRVGGFSLGVSAVLFAGIAIGSVDPRLRLPEIVHLFGLVTFVYVVGLGSAPGFFASLRRRGLQASALALGCVLVAAGLVAVLAPLLGLSPTTAAGLFAGATTNTPALAAVVDAIGEAGDQAGPVLGYSLAYPFGVLGALATIALVPRLFRIDLAREGVGPDDAPGLGVHVETATVAIERELPEMSVGFLRERLGLRVVFSRVRRGERLAVVTDDVVLHRGDEVGIVGEREHVEAAIAQLGRALDDRLELDRSEIDFRRMVVSNAALAERPLAELALGERFGAVVTRVRRGDDEFVAEPSLVIELGDAVRVVAPRGRLAAVARFLGDSQRALAEIDVISFSLGIGLGLVLGQLPIPLPGDRSFTLGFAGGPLVVGLVLGRLGRSGPLVWTLPHAAGMTLRQVGLVLFLAGIGTRAGWAFAEAVQRGGVPAVIGLGMLVTLAVASLAVVIGHRVLHIPASVVVGMLAGIQTQPADLAFASERTRNEVPAMGYAAVYPVATIAKIVLAQLLLG